MTLANQALTLRAKLLVAEYGRKRVIAALAQIEDVEFETIEQEVEAVRERKSSRSRRPKTLPELLKEAEIEPQTFSLVEKVACAYENKRYLSELWRVRKFLESHGVDANRIRARTAALPLVVKVLGGLSEGELTEIVAGLSRPVRGDLRIIADQILGPSKEDSRAAKEIARDSDPCDAPVRTEGESSSSIPSSDMQETKTFVRDRGCQSGRAADGSGAVGSRSPADGADG